MPWARLRHDRCHHDAETIAKALHGQWRDEHLLALAQARALSDLDHQKIRACDRQIEAPLGTVAARQEREAVRPMVRPRKRTRHRVTGVDLTAMAGIEEPTALTIIRAIGLDLGRWPTVQQCTSWLGRCPHHRVSGGQG
jgi:transposase